MGLDRREGGLYYSNVWFPEPVNWHDGTLEIITEQGRGGLCVKANWQTSCIWCRMIVHVDLYWWCLMREWHSDGPFSKQTSIDADGSGSRQMHVSIVTHIKLFQCVSGIIPRADQRGGISRTHVHINQWIGKPCIIFKTLLTYEKKQFSQRPKWLRFMSIIC